MKYKAYTLKNFRTIPQLEKLSETEKVNIEVVGHVLPFKVNNYVIDELIDWDNFQNDPFFLLSFPQKDMLKPKHFNTIKKLIDTGADKERLASEINQIRLTLNPNPAGQEHNIPELQGERLRGIQHKYNETMLFFPSQGQTCHNYCTFCFRWSQFGMKDHKFAMKEASKMVEYLRENPQITDVLFTGGDPAIMKTKIFENYFNALLDAELPNLQTIRIGTKSLTYWPYRFTTDEDAEELLQLFEKTINRGVNISIMAHFNHYKALETEAVKDAIKRIRSTGAQIRTQSPVMNRINADPEIWAKMWSKQVNMGLIPYYMFVARDTGAQDYFAISLEKAIDIYNKAYSQVSGLSRTVRGPSMSSDPGKVHLLGITEINNEKVFAMRLIQARNPEWINRMFFAKYNPNAQWLTDLEPAFGEKKFFFQS